MEITIQKEELISSSCKVKLMLNIYKHVSPFAIQSKVKKICQVNNVCHNLYGRSLVLMERKSALLFPQTGINCRQQKPIKSRLL